MTYGLQRVITPNVESRASYNTENTSRKMCLFIYRTYYLCAWRERQVLGIFQLSEMILGTHIQE